MQTCGELCLSPIGLSLVNKLSPIKFASLLMAVWYTANAFANKLAGQLSALYPDNKTTYIMGIGLHNLNEYFMMFVIMVGAAAVILFILSAQLRKMMQ
jgi:POT family proton-dependent oligopeptide transporter